MDLEQLTAALLEAGLPPESFRIDGVHESDPLPTDFWFLRRRPEGGWEAGSFERGGYDVRARFAVESEATRWFYATLTGRQ